MPARKSASAVLGTCAPRARPTIVGAIWLALVVSLPAGGVLLAIEGVVRWIF